MADAGFDDGLSTVLETHHAGRANGSMLADATAIIRLARLDPLEYARQRKGEAKALGISVSALDKEVREHQRSTRAQAVVSAGRSWLRECQYTQQGEVRSNLANTLLALRADPRVATIARYDEMLRLPILQQPVPGAQLEHEHFEPRPIRDEDYTAIQEFFGIM